MSGLRVVHSVQGDVDEADAFDASRERFDKTATFLATPQARQMDHSQMKQEIERRSRELARTLYQDWLDSLSPAEAEAAVVDAEGNERTRKRIQSRELETVFGTVTLSARATGWRVTRACIRLMRN